MPRPDGTPTTTERGYGQAHMRARTEAAKRVDAGQALCCRCWRLIIPGTPWDLDHNLTRTGYLGPAHASCNRRAGQAAGARAKKTRRVRRAALIVARTSSSW